MLVGSLATAPGCSEPGTTRADFAERADAICRRANQRVEALGRPDSPEEFLDLSQRAEIITRDALDDLRVLDPPEDDRAAIDRMLELLTRALDRVSDLRLAAQKRDIREVRKVQKDIELATEEAAAIARDFGLEVCVGAGLRTPGS